MGSERDHGDGHAAGNAIENIAPGEPAELIWPFPEPGQWELACYLSGHYGAGMVQMVTVTE